MALFDTRIAVYRRQMIAPETAPPFHILIIDDELEFTAICGLILAPVGCVVTTAPDGNAALEKLRAGGPLPDLILLDLGMPGVNGWEFRKQQLRCPVLRVVPTVVLTAFDANREQLEDLGILTVLEKPITLEQLKGLVVVAGEVSAQRCG